MYKGNMSHAMKQLQVFNYLLLAASAIFVWFTQQELIFPQRSAPKYVFDLCMVFGTTLLSLFWTT